MDFLPSYTGNDVKQFVAVIEKCPDTGLYVGHVPGLPGAHSQGATLEELNANLREVLELLVEENVEPESEFVGTQLISVH
jgi:predicted RNase H-like HicB family nuclease